MRAWIVSCLGLVGAAAPGLALAHGMRSAYLEVQEQAPGRALVALRVSAPDAVVAAALAGCELRAVPGAPRRADDGDTRAFVATCRQPIAATAVSVTGLGAEIEEAVVRVVLADGKAHAAVLTASAPSFVARSPGRASEVLSRYATAGVAHIAGGLDHLLFLLLLVLSLRRLGPILWAETAFSLSHGVAFALTASGAVEVAPAPVEALIALSLVLLALDVGKAARPRTVALWALGFGAVHGLGFAGGLRELGVPRDQLGAAVLGFGAGVELGQLVFVVATWAALRGLGRLGRALAGPRPEAVARWRRGGAWLVVHAPPAAAVATGALSTAWLAERALAALAG